MFFKILTVMTAAVFCGCSTHPMGWRQSAVVKKPDDICLNELKEKITKLSAIKEIKSFDLFTEEPYLVLTNRPQKPYPHDNKPHAVEGSEKFFMLYIEGDECYVGMLNEMEYITEREKIKKCKCRASKIK